MKPALLTLSILLALPAPALAEPVLTPLKPCYVSAFSQEQWSSEPISLTGTGFTPGAAVDLLLDGNAAGRTTAGSDGSIVGALNAPFQRTGEREFTVSASEAGRPPVSLTSRVSALMVTVSPKRAKSTHRVTFTGRGFTDPTLPVYMHYTLRGRHRKTVKLARPAGPCGTFKVRRRQFPMRRPAVGRWTLRIEQEKRFRAQPVKPYAVVDVEVRRRLIRR